MASPTYGSLINSLNIYVDTSRDLDGPGDNVNLQLAENSIAIQDGQLMKLSLTEFTMYRNFYSVNINNSKFRLTTDAGASELEITNKNYRTIGDVIADFAEKLRAQLQTDTGVTCTAGTVLPADTGSSMPNTFSGRSPRERRRCMRRFGSTSPLIGCSNLPIGRSTPA